MKAFYAADLFCGAGGTSTGLLQACDQVGRKLHLTAVNHWQRAVETHAANHPSAAHHCEDLTTLDPRKAVPGGKLDLLVASPECTHHSVARGGKPVNDQSRASAWCVLRWLTALTVDRVLIENVPEFESWGPIGSTGKPLQSRKGETFAAFVTGLESLGYTVAWRVLNAADHGGVTTRRRLFIQAARGRRKIVWPTPTHEQHASKAGLFGNLKPWRAAREVIDWSLTGSSIFDRKKPLSENTLKRIEAGLRKFGGAAAEPFLLLLRGTDRGHIESSARLSSEPVPTLSAGGTHVGLCEPFILPHRQFEQMDVDSVDRPMRTITAQNGGCNALVEPFILPPEGIHRGNSPRSVNQPMQTITAGRGGGCLVQVTHGGRELSIDNPLPTITTAHRGEIGLVEPFLVPQMSQNEPRSVGRPVPTLTTTSRGVGLCEPFLVPFYANGEADSISDPLRTVTTKDRHAIVEPTRQIDIRFRMLQPHELAAAMGFPTGYKITGNRSDQVRQVGNAVEVNTARELCSALMEQRP